MHTEHSIQELKKKFFERFEALEEFLIWRSDTVSDLQKAIELVDAVDAAYDQFDQARRA